MDDADRQTVAIARAIGKDPVWVVAALLAQHALTPAEAEIVRI